MKVENLEKLSMTAEVIFGKFCFNAKGEFVGCLLLLSSEISDAMIDAWCYLFKSGTL